MRFRLSLSFIMSLFCSTLLAQSTQRGIVLEYNGSNAKTPLANVEIIVNNAGSTISDENGEFVLHFRTLKPGDKISVRRIEKAGYELFNTDVVSRFVITNNDAPITIVMSKTKTIREIRQTYTDYAHSHFDANYAKETKALDDSYKNGKIDKSTFEQKKKELQNRYDEMFENIDNYVERFARIDLSELSSIDKKVLDLMKAGNIVQAIKAYDSANLLDSYKTHSRNLARLNIAENKMSNAAKRHTDNLEKIKKSLSNQINLLWLAGGTDNFNKIMTIHKELADANPTDYDTQVKFADLCRTTNHIDEALKYYDSALEVAGNDVSKISKVRISKGALYSKMRNLDLASYECMSALHDLDSLADVRNDSYLNLYDRAFAQRILASIFTRNNDYKNAIDYYTWSLAAHHALVDIDSVKYVRDYGETLIEYGCVLNKTDRYEEAETALSYAVLIFEKQYTYSPKTNAGPLAKAYDALGQLYFSQNRMLLCEEKLWMALVYFKQACEYNSEMYLGLAGYCFQKMGRLHINEKKFDRAMDVYDRSIELFNKASEYNPYEYKGSIAFSNLRKGTVYWLSGDYEKALECDILAEKQYTEYANSSKENVNNSLGACAYYTGECFFKLGDYKNALACYERAYKYYQSEEYLYKLKRMRSYIKIFSD